MTKTTLNRGGEGGNLYVPLGVTLWPINYQTGQSVSTVLSEVVALANLKFVQGSEIFKIR